MELVLARVPRHGAAQMRAFAVDRHDPVRLGVDDEEPSRRVEVRRVVVVLEELQQILNVDAGVDLSAERLRLERPEETGKQRAEAGKETSEFREKQQHRAEHAESEQLPPAQSRGETFASGVGPDHGNGAGTFQGTKRSIPVPRMAVPTKVMTR